MFSNSIEDVSYLFNKTKYLFNINNEIFFLIQKCFFCFPILNSSDMVVKLFSDIYLRNLSNIKIKTFSVFYSKIFTRLFSSCEQVQDQDRQPAVLIRSGALLPAEVQYDTT